MVFIIGREMWQLTHKFQPQRHFPRCTTGFDWAALLLLCLSFLVLLLSFANSQKRCLEQSSDKKGNWLKWIPLTGEGVRKCKGCHFTVTDDEEDLLHFSVKEYLLLVSPGNWHDKMEIQKKALSHGIFPGWCLKNSSTVLSVKERTRNRLTQVAIHSY